MGTHILATAIPDLSPDKVPARHSGLEYTPRFIPPHVLAKRDPPKKVRAPKTKAESLLARDLVCSRGLEVVRRRLCGNCLKGFRGSLVVQDRASKDFVQVQDCRERVI